MSYNLNPIRVLISNLMSCLGSEAADRSEQCDHTGVRLPACTRSLADLRLSGHPTLARGLQLALTSTLALGRCQSSNKRTP